MKAKAIALFLCVSLTIVGLDRPASALTPNEKFVTAIHQEFLFRPPESHELLWWTTVLNSQSRAYVAQQVIQLPEFKSNYVTWLSEIYFSQTKPSTAAGTAILSALNSSNDFMVAEVAILASSSYYQNADGANGGFVEQLYWDVLHRAADTSGLAYWTGQLDSGAKTRSQVATFLIRSSEAAGRRVRGVTPMTTCPVTQMGTDAGFAAGSYCIILDRVADASGASYWTSQLTGSGQVTTLWAQLAGSTEYFNNAQ